MVALRTMRKPRAGVCVEVGSVRIGKGTLTTTSVQEGVCDSGFLNSVFESPEQGVFHKITFALQRQTPFNCMLPCQRQDERLE